MIQAKKLKTYFGIIQDYKLLIKFTLSFTVVFSCVICYLLAPNVGFHNTGIGLSVLILFLGGMCVTGSANAINQALEKNTDALMSRTANRPVAAGRMTVEHAAVFGIVLGIIGIALLWIYFNGLTALVSAFSWVLYAFIYTPLKKINSIAVLVGALPGALPCLIGWVAATDALNPMLAIKLLNENRYILNINGWILFLIQFLWQFPHFWAIAWVAHTDYSKAGFKLLPSDKGPTRFTAMQTVLYAALMVPVGLLPYYFELTGMVSMWIVLCCNIGILIQSIRLLKAMNVAAARRVMFSSYIYLPIVFLALLADKN